MKNLFKQAHALTRATIQAGDNYQATFILCLRAIIADAKQASSEPMANQFNTIFEAIGYTAPQYNAVPFSKPQAVWNTKHPVVKACLAIHSLGVSKFFMLVLMMFIVGLFIGGTL